MSGLPATGKSTISRELAKRLSGIVLDKDAIRSALFSPNDIEYSLMQDDFCMNIMLQTAAYILAKDPYRMVFLDGRPFSRRDQIEQVINQAEKLNQTWRILECICSEASARRRLEEQKKSGEHPAADRDYQLYLRVKQRFDEITLPKTIIDTDRTIEECINTAFDALQ